MPNGPFNIIQYDGYCDLIKTQSENQTECGGRKKLSSSLEAVAELFCFLSLWRQRI